MRFESLVNRDLRGYSASSPWTGWADRAGM